MRGGWFHHFQWGSSEARGVEAVELEEPEGMFTREEDVEAHALRERGWSISAIARHLGRDPKTVRAHLAREREPEQRARGEDLFERFVPYLRQRLADDPHVRVSVLERELRECGFEASYQTLTREIRQRGLRPRCEACAGVGGRATAMIEHPVGEETQWDWLEFPETPWGQPGLVQVGVLAHSGKLRGMFCESMQTPHLLQAMDGVVRRLGGLTRQWRIDRMQGAVIPGTDRLCAAFADFAKYHAVQVKVCPPRRANRKGVVEAGNDYLAQSWWRVVDVGSPEDAQRSLDRFCTHVGDVRPRHTADGAITTVEQLARTEGLRPVAERPYPAVVEVGRGVSWGALVSFEGNRYSVPSAYVDGHVLVHAPLGADWIELRTLTGVVIVRHRRHPAGAHALERRPEHRAELERLVLAGFTTDAPCRRKPNKPPSEAARALAVELSGDTVPEVDARAADVGTVVSLERYAEWVTR